MASRAQQRRHTGACLEDGRPPAAIPQQRGRDVILDSIEDFVSEETLLPRPPRQNAEDAALDAFELEGSAFVDPSVPTGTSTAGTQDADGGRRTFALPVWRSFTAAGIAGSVILLGLLVKPSSPPLFPADAPRGSALASTAETRPPALPTATASPPPELPTATASPETRPPAPPVDAAAESARPLRQDQPAQVEPAGSSAASAPAVRATDAGFPSPSFTTGTVMASSPSLPVDAGIGVVLPATGPVPEIPPATLRAAVSSESPDINPPVAPEPAVPSAHDQVSAVLGQFEAAYSRLDAGFVQTIWPSVDRPRLERAFRNLTWQTLEFSECRLDVAGATATAICTGVVQYGTRVGNQRAREARRWTFALREASAGWQIQNVLMR